MHLLQPGIDARGVALVVPVVCVSCIAHNANCPARPGLALTISQPGQECAANREHAQFVTRFEQVAYVSLVHHHLCGGAHWQDR